MHDVESRDEQFHTNIRLGAHVRVKKEIWVLSCTFVLDLVEGQERSSIRPRTSPQKFGKCGEIKLIVSKKMFSQRNIHFRKCSEQFMFVQFEIAILAQAGCASIPSDSAPKNSSHDVRGAPTAPCWERSPSSSFFPHYGREIRALIHIFVSSFISE